MFLLHFLSDSGVWYLFLVPVAHIAYVFLGGLLLLLFGRTRRQVGLWAEKRLTLGRGKPPRRRSSRPPAEEDDDAAS